MNTVILCVRLNSTRLPDKALAVLNGRTVLQHVIERYQSVRAVDCLIVATSNQSKDDRIAILCEKLDISCYRGSLNNVVMRMNDALEECAPDTEFVFRALGDMPLFSVELLNWRFDILRKRRADVVWTGYSDEPWPVYGSRESPWSRRAWDHIVYNSTGEDKVHAGQWLYRNLKSYRVLYTQPLQDEFYLPARLELDTTADLAFFQSVYDALWTEPGGPPTLEVLRWLRTRPDVLALNSSVEEKTLTKVNWRKRGSAWACYECGAQPLETGTIKKDDDGRYLETRCGRCGTKRKFVEVPRFLARRKE